MASEGSSNLLMVAFHYPPYGVSSGLRRTHAFSRFLPEHGWQPLVLTAHPRAYDTVKSDNAHMDVEEEEPTVVRAFALDTVRHLGFRGKYPGILALPDRWSSWLPAAVMNGMSLIRKHEVKVIWSTYPIATAHLIGLCLCKLSGLPWVADFRDPMIDQVHPVGRLKRKIFRFIEKRTLAHASAVCFTTPGALQDYKTRYPGIDSSHWTCIHNGYDEQDFTGLTAPASNTPESELDPPQPITLVHSGTLYPLERDPRCFFAALARLKATGEVTQDKLRVILRATGHDDFIKDQLQQHAIDDIVTLEQDIEYSQALREMCDADGLLLFQASNCNYQIPAKLYEYMRSGSPLLALTDPSGDTAGLIHRENAGIVANLHDVESSMEGVKSLLETIRSSRFKPVSPERLRQYSRREQAAQLAEFLNQIASKR